jgi:TonB family protein
MSRRSLEEVFSPNPTLPLFAALGCHCLLFILNPTILKRGTSSFGELPPMVIKMADALPVLAPPIPKPEIKQPPKPKAKPKPKPVPKKRAGLAPKMHPKPPIMQAKPKPVRRTFISKVELPKFVPHDNDELLASSPRPGLAPAAAKPMARAPMATPMLHGKFHGIVADDVHFQLTDKSSLAGMNTRTVAIPLAEERGDSPMLPSASLHNAPKGIQTGGYRFTPGEGSGELAGRNKSGYHGVIRTERREEGGLSASGAAGKTIKGNGFEISGSVGNRKILSRQLPEYPQWAEEKGIVAAVQIYFTVRPDGTIRSTLRIEKSSGYSELDQLAKEALLKWRFSPSNANDESVSWGEITFRFTLA